MKIKILPAIAALALGLQTIQAQVNSGSNGSDGALDFSGISVTTNIVIDMHDHPTGICNYTYVNIPSNVTVTFVPNTGNTPVYWLVQSNIVVSGVINVSGGIVPFGQSQGAAGGPGGYQGGNGANGSVPATSGLGPGGGAPGGNLGATSGTYNYGNQYLIPLLGGSGGGGVGCGLGGGGGGGAILIATSGSITLGGGILANGGYGIGGLGCGGSSSGSGGAVRLIAAHISGNGAVSASPGGRVRFDTYDSEITVGVNGQFSTGSQFIVIPTSGQLPQLTVTSVGGVPVSPSPTGTLTTPDAVLSALQTDPVPIVVSCANLPLHSLITVSVKPANGSPVSATGYNDTGTQSSSTATLSINIPRGGGLIYATAATSN
jgi:hypothetical protein